MTTSATTTPGACATSHRVGTVLQCDYLLVYDKHDADDPQQPLIYRRILLMDFNHGILCVCVVQEDAAPVNNQFTMDLRLQAKSSEFPQGRVTVRGYGTQHMIGYDNELTLMPTAPQVQWLRDARTQQ